MRGRRPAWALLPGGKDLYRYYVKYHTTTDMTPKEIHELGLAQVREISSQLAAD